jgi:hypothetical protein
VVSVRVVVRVRAVCVWGDWSWCQGGQSDQSDQGGQVGIRYSYRVARRG